jgi:hypothetical protein
VRITPGRTRDNRADVSGEFNLSADFDYPSADAPQHVHVSGETTVKLSVDIEIQIQAFHITYMRFLPTFEADGQLSVLGEASLSDDIQLIPETPLAEIVVPTGSVTLTCTPTYSAKMTLNGSVSLGATCGCGYTTTLGDGLEYTQGSGWQAITQEKTTPSFTLASNASVSFDANLDCVPMHQELYLQIEHCAGPYLEADIPGLKLAGHVQANPFGALLSATPYVKGGIGVKAELWGKTLLDHDWTMEHDFTPIAKFFPFTGSPTDGGVDLTVD